MNHLKTLAGLLVAAAVAVPALSMAQDRDDHHDDRRTEQGHDDHRAPPSGYHWVQVNGDFVLAAVATGVIADMLLGN